MATLCHGHALFLIRIFEPPNISRARRACKVREPWLALCRKTCLGKPNSPRAARDVLVPPEGGFGRSLFGDVP